jgi:hypothetical protein
MSYAMTKSRQFDRHFDPFYRDSTMHGHPVTGYRVALQGTYVTGSDRPLFFSTPVSIAVHATSPEIVLERQVPPPVGSHGEVDSYDSHQRFDVAVQSQYRESEGQTNPWMPDTTENTKPRAWFEEEELEKLPLDERQKRLVEMEMEQWAKRERAIIELQQQRLNLLVQKFQAREDEALIKRQRRVEAVLAEREQKRLEAVERIEKKRLKVLRTLTEQRRQMTTKKHTKRDIVQDYSDQGSSAYAPLRRFGRADAMCYMNRAVYGKRDILTDTSVAALDEIEALYRKADIPSLKSQKIERRADRIHQEMLKMVEISVLEKRGGIEKKVQPLKIAQRINKPPPRPPTPEVKAAVDDDEREMAVILIQRLLRGRALQSEMYRCLENQRQLIRELRTVEALREVEEKAETEDEKQAAEAARQHMEQAATVEGKIAGEMLHFLNHQLQRRLEERRIDAMMKLAERERRRREAVEAGQREEELKRQAIEDEAFRRVMGTNYETAESYLESIINSSIQTAASDLATAIARRDAEKITKFTSTAAIRNGDDTIVARDLVAAFLFPEIEKETLRKRLAIEQRRIRRAADNSVRLLGGD